jgi:hypothetical protein
MSISHFRNADDPNTQNFNIGCNSLDANIVIAGTFNIDNLETNNITSTGTITANNIASTGLVTNTNKAIFNVLQASGNTTLNNLGVGGNMSSFNLNVGNTITCQGSSVGVMGFNTNVAYNINSINQFRFPKQITIGGTFITFPFPVNYTNIYVFPYSGSYNQGSITRMSIAVGVFTKALSIQVIDVTNNNNVICERTNITTSGWSVQDLGLINNVPFTPSVFFLNVAAGAGSNTSQVGALTVSFAN